VQRVAGRTLVYAALPIIRQGQPREFLVLATVERPFLGALEDLAGPLLSAGAIAMVVAIVIGLMLASSISGPIGRLTRATEEIARGNFDERIPEEGRDEVARLAVSFNAMSRAVKHSQETQKDFLANVSHELKTPLTSIQGFAQAIAEGAIHDLEGAQRAANLIYDESQRMARLVGDLLTLARFDAGAVVVPHTPLDLTTMLPVWVARFQSRAKEAGVSLNLAMDSPPPIEGDAERLEQVVANLMDNAIKYNRVGGRVDVTAGRENGALSSPQGRPRKGTDSSRGWAVIRVRDTGAGIRKSNLPRLFERFYRGDKARLAGGSGLGLSIAEEIVKAHRGRIEVQSEEGKGTSFSLWLPAKE
jgi:two-component system OmpR family sensor kinase